MGLTLEQRIRRLEDECAIRRLLYRYGHCLDYGLEEEFAGLFADDAVLDYHGRAPYRGREEMLAVAQRHTRAPEHVHKHLVLSSLIDVDGDCGTATSYFIRVDGGPDGPVVRSFGRYHDELVRCDDGAWRFRSRRHEPESRTPYAWAEAVEAAAAETERRAL